MVRVDHVGLFVLVDRVKDLEGPGVDELVVTVYEDDHVVFATVLHDGAVDARQSSLPLFITEESDLEGRRVLVDELLDEVGSAVSGSVVSDDHPQFVRLVVQVVDRLQVVLVAVVLCVVHSGDQHAKGQFLVSEGVLGEQTGVFLPLPLLHLVYRPSVHVLRTEVQTQQLESCPCCPVFLQKVRTR